MQTLLFKSFRRRRVVVLIFIALGLSLLLPWVLLATTGWRLDPVANFAAGRALDRDLVTLETGRMLLKWHRGSGLRFDGANAILRAADGSMLSLSDLRIHWTTERLRSRCLLPAEVHIASIRLDLREDAEGRSSWRQPGETEEVPDPEKDFAWHLEDLPVWIWPHEPEVFRLMVKEVAASWNLPSIRSQGRLDLSEIDVQAIQATNALHVEANATWLAESSPAEFTMVVQWDDRGRELSALFRHDQISVQDLVKLTPPDLVPANVEVNGRFQTKASAVLRMEPFRTRKVSMEWLSDTWIITAKDYLPQPVEIDPVAFVLDADFEENRIAVSGLDLALPWVRISMDPIQTCLNSEFTAILCISGDGMRLDEVLPWLPAEHLDSLPIGMKDAALLAIEPFIVRAQIQVHPRGLDGIPKWGTLDIAAASGIKVSDDRIPVSLNLSLAPGTLLWDVDLKAGPVHPSRWSMVSIFENLPVPLDTLHFGAEIEMEASGTSINLPETIRLGARFSPGTVKGLPGLELPLPFDELHIAAALSPRTNRLDALDIKVAALGATLTIDNTSGSFAEDHFDLTSRVTLSDFNLTATERYWMPLIPGEHLEILSSMNPRGHLSEFELNIVAGGAIHAAVENPVSLIRDMRFHAGIRETSMAAMPEILVEFDPWTFEGSLEQVKVHVPMIRASHIDIPYTTIVVLNPTDPIPTVQFSSSVALDLAHTRDLVARLPIGIDPALAEELADFRGALRASIQAAFPLQAELDIGQIRATSRLDLDGLRIPPAWLPFQEGAATLAFDATWDGNLATVNGDFNTGSLSLPPWVHGPINNEFQIQSDLSGLAHGHLRCDLSDVHIEVEPFNLRKVAGEPAEFGVRMRTASLGDPLLTTVNADFNYNLREQGMFSGDFRFRNDDRSVFGGIERAELSGIEIKGSRVDLKLAVLPELLRMDIHAATIDFPYIMDALSPLIQDLLLADEKGVDTDFPTDGGQTLEPIPSKSVEAGWPAAIREIEWSTRIDRLVLSPGRELSNTRGNVILHDFFPRQISLTGEGENQTLLNFAANEVSPGLLKLDLLLPDVAGLANLLVSPLLLLDLPDTPMGNNLEVARRIPDSFAGGRLLLDGYLRLDLSDPHLSGKFSCEDLYMIKAPCLLRLVAAASGKGFSENVAFRTFAMEHFDLDRTQVSLRQLRFDGPVTMNIHEGLYRFSDQFIRVKGDHTLTNFEIEGPILGPPDIYVDNRLTRMLGTDESDWSGM